MGASDEYDIKNFPWIKDLNIWQKILLFIRGIAYIPYASIKTFIVKDKPNPLNNKKDLNGIKHCASSKDFDMQLIKKMAKEHTATINDYITAATGITVKKYFAKHNFNHT